MKKKIVKATLAIFIITWIAITGFFVKGYFENAEDSNFCQQKRHELYTDKEYWRKRYGQTLESEIEWQIIKGAHVNSGDIRYLSLGKDFDLKSNLEGLVTVNRAESEEDYRFKLIFDRNGLAIIENFRQSN